MASTSCAKKCMVVFNIICTLIALVLIAFGIYVICSYDTNEMGSLAAYAYIGVGVATLVIVLIGCFGTLREHVCCTVTFTILLFIVMIGQVAVLALLTYQNQSLASNLSNSLDATWEQELVTPGAMSQYEDWFHCCGRGSPQDYIVNERLPPPTCYKDGDNTKPSNLIMNGCRVEMENFWVRLLTIFNILGWVLVAFELIACITSCIMCNSIRNDRRRSYF